MHNDGDLESYDRGIKGSSVDTEDTRASGIAEEIVKGVVIEMQCTMNTQNMVYD